MSTSKLLIMTLLAVAFLSVVFSQRHSPWFARKDDRLEAIKGKVHESYKERITNRTSRSYHQIVSASQSPRNMHLALLGTQGNAALNVKCGETKVQIIVNKELFGRGLAFPPSSLRLGDNPESTGTCAPVFGDSASSDIVITAGLHECDGENWVSGDWLVYSNKLVFSPPATVISTGNLVIGGARIVIPIECYNRRRLTGRRDSDLPTWNSVSSTVRGAGLLHFSLRVMKDDWSGPRISTTFQLGEPVNLQADVDGQWHPPLRIYVDHCTATLSSDPLSEPSYNIIANHGCLTDSRFYGSSSSQFLPRSRQNTLCFRIERIPFLINSQDQVFVNCHLRAALERNPSDMQNKACFFHFDSHSWHAVDGDEAVCRCCEINDCSSWTEVKAADVPISPLASGSKIDTSVGPLKMLPLHSH